MATPQATSALAEMFNQWGRNIVYNQFKKYSPLFDKKIIKRDEASEGLISVVTRKGEQSSAGFIPDGGVRKAASAIQFAKGVITYKIMDMPITFQLGQLRTAKGKAGINIFKENMESSSETAARLFDRSLLSHTLGLPAANVAAGQVTMTIADSSGYGEGATVDQVRAGVVIDTFQVTNLAISLGLSTVVTFTPALTVGLDITTDTLVLQGSNTSTTRPLNLTDVNTAATTMYGLAVADFPSGLTVPGSTVATWSNESAQDLHKTIQLISGNDRCTHIICAPAGSALIKNAIQPQMRFAEGTQVVDPLGFRPVFDGMIIVEDGNQAASRFDFINNKYLEIAEFWPWGPDSDGVDGRGTGSFENAIKVERDTFSAVLLASMGYELKCTYRRAQGQFTGITS